jgi:hypothetical protein
MRTLATRCQCVCFGEPPRALTGHPPSPSGKLNPCSGLLVSSLARASATRFRSVCRATLSALLRYPGRSALFSVLSPSSGVPMLLPPSAPL